MCSLCAPAASEGECCAELGGGHSDSLLAIAFTDEGLVVTGGADDEIVGLSEAFAYSGVSATIASLWSVRESATHDLMRAFFQHLRAGHGTAAALQLAQADVRKAHPNPYYWAAFVLTGPPGGSAPSVTERGR